MALRELRLAVDARPSDVVEVQMRVEDVGDVVRGVAEGVERLHELAAHLRVALDVVHPDVDERETARPPDEEPAHRHLELGVGVQELLVRRPVLFGRLREEHRRRDDEAPVDDGKDLELADAHGTSMRAPTLRTPCRSDPVRGRRALRERAEPQPASGRGPS